MRVLVTAASQHGSTAAIAETIGEELESRGLQVTLAAPEQVGPLSGFDAVVLGSAVYTGHWMGSAITLARRIAREIAGRPVWLFSSGPVGDPSGKAAQQMNTDPVELGSIRSMTGARGHAIFAGRLDRHQLRGLQRTALWFFRGLEGDFRDWEVIRSWARSIADELVAPAAEQR